MSSARGLVARDLRVAVDNKEILKGIDLTVEPGKVHALMGPNGSGKSTLAFTLAGHPGYQVLGGSASLDGEDLLELSPDKRAKAGLFLSFQYPAAIPGVSVANFVRTARQSVRPGDLTPAKFRKLIFDKLDTLDMDPAFLGRYVNDGFSGGEKKRLEMLQMAIIARRSRDPVRRSRSPLVASRHRSDRKAEPTCAGVEIRGGMGPGLAAISRSPST